jgi:DNA-binding transcriptional regulator YiaG
VRFQAHLREWRRFREAKNEGICLSARQTELCSRDFAPLLQARHRDIYGRAAKLRSTKEVTLNGPDLKHWRKLMGYTQQQAALVLGVTRATVQNWEHQITRIPSSVDLACRIILLQSKRRPEYGPITLVYLDTPLPTAAVKPTHPGNFVCKTCTDSGSAFAEILARRSSPGFFHPMIFDNVGAVIWSGRELTTASEEYQASSPENPLRQTREVMAAAGPRNLDAWDLKKWRKRLRLNQFEAAAQLGVHRGALQDWEQEKRPIPRAVELACEELLRLAQRRPEFGPVFLVYSDGSLLQRSNETYQVSLLRCEHHQNNQSAMRASRMDANNPLFSDPIIVAEDGSVVWESSALKHEIRRPEPTEGSLTNEPL